jgi:hypothetical protein
MSMEGGQLRRGESSPLGSAPGRTNGQPNWGSNIMSLFQRPLDKDV